MNSWHIGMRVRREGTRRVGVLTLVLGDGRAYVNYAGQYRLVPLGELLAYVRPPRRRPQPRPSVPADPPRRRAGGLVLDWRRARRKAAPATGCAHRWILDARSFGRCSVCGAERAFGPFRLREDLPCPS